MRCLFFAIALLGLSGPAEAVGRRGVAVSPPIGQENTASAGSAIFQRENVWQVEGLIILADAPEAELSTGDRLAFYIKSKKKIVACPNEYGGANCLIDRTPVNHIFTEKASGLGTGKIQLAKPVPYEVGHYVDTPGDKGTFRQQLSFLGVSGSTLRFSYREFVNDMARPAFTDEVTFTLSGTFPETITYKDVVIDVLGISNAGLRYVVKSTTLKYIEPPGAPAQ
ncbi:hypothetical protein FJQ54_01440 [Sandaracinobacter neustonicus]|uniref:Uncharacterized protein n=1 Tax=Sandaracinobacter neustonicus TaxID=1715348 RepID=A0A501XUV3_9SPHN|nr:hypothetical protein [Sandaracinobacter neustonicus]TPE64468.1 hypothetical protein FJQ54_01440 [Sandaracinobacter neustonicus]